MAQTHTEERIRWVLPIINKDMKLSDVARVCPYSKRSLERWVAAYKKHGEKGLTPCSTQPKSHPRETPLWIKNRVLEIRNDTGKCALKIHWQLHKEGIEIHERTIGKILSAEGLVRGYRVKKVKYTYLKATRHPGDLLEMDVKFVPGRIAGKRYFQYTVIDTASRWRHLEVFDEQTTDHAIRMMEIVQKRFPYPIRALKTDNHATFTNYYLGTNKRSDLTVKTVHPLDQWCRAQGIVHYLIDRGKPAQNGTVERSHREDEEKFYQKHTFTRVDVLQRRLRVWNDYYNNLEHCGLGGKTPYEFLTDYSTT